jgi:hypothetical protein
MFDLLTSGIVINKFVLTSIAISGRPLLNESSSEQREQSKKSEEKRKDFCAVNIRMAC